MGAPHGSGAAASLAFGEFTRLCDEAGPERCALTEGGGAREKFDALAARLRDHPLEVDGEVVLDYPYLVSLTHGYLSDPLDWEELGEQLQSFSEQVDAAGDVAGAVAVPSAAPVRHQADPATSSGDAQDTEDRSTDAEAPYHGTMCSDSVNPTSARRWIETAAQQDSIAPYFGRQQTWDSGVCARWSLPAPGRYLGPFDRPTSAPVLVVGNTFDPITPYTSAVSTAARIPGARLLTIDGYGHTSGGVPSSCADAAIEEYLVDATLPAEGAVCPQDVAPFAPEPAEGDAADEG